MKKKLIAENAKNYKMRTGKNIEDVVDTLRYQSKQSKNEPEEEEIEIFLKTKFMRLSEKTGKNYKSAAIPLLNLEEYLTSIITDSNESIESGSKEINRHQVVLGAKHYVGIDIAYDPQKKQFDIIFFDPLDEDSAYNSYFLQCIIDAFKNIDATVRIISCPSNMQAAGSSCWIFAILALAEFAKVDNLFDSMVGNCEIKKTQDESSSFSVYTLASKFLSEKLIDTTQSYTLMNQFLAGKYKLKERIVKINTHKEKYEEEGKNQLIERKRNKWAKQLDEIDKTETKNELTNESTSTDENDVSNNVEERHNIYQKK